MAFVSAASVNQRISQGSSPFDTVGVPRDGTAYFGFRQAEESPSPVSRKRATGARAMGSPRFMKRS